MNDGSAVWYLFFVCCVLFMFLKTAVGRRRREDISQTEVSKSMEGNLSARFRIRGIWRVERGGGEAPKEEAPGVVEELWRGREM